MQRRSVFYNNSKKKYFKVINSQFEFFKMEAAGPRGQCVLRFTGPALATCLIFYLWPQLTQLHLACKSLTGCLDYHLGFLRLLGHVYREFKKQWPEWHQQCHKSLIWLLEWGKILLLLVWHAFWCNFLTQSAKWQC